MVDNHLDSAVEDVRPTAPSQTPHLFSLPSFHFSLLVFKVSVDQSLNVDLLLCIVSFSCRITHFDNHENFPALLSPQIASPPLSHFLLETMTVSDILIRFLSLLSFLMVSTLFLCAAFWVTVSDLFPTY